MFIFESIGTSELILIGIIALIFLGPRKLPQIAKTIGKTMADFRNTTNEFKSTWEREVNFEDEEKALRTGELTDTPVARMTPVGDHEANAVSIPEVKEIDKAAFDHAAAHGPVDETADAETRDEHRDGAETTGKESLSDKRSWL
ncbi:MAG: Sec-independent protein translocase protein TatB [Pyrinomonadaceae bacterium]